MTRLIERRIDWISATFPKSVSPEDVFSTVEWTVTGRGLHGYKVAMESSEWGVWAQSDGTDAQGLQMTFSGDALNRMRASSGMVDISLIALLNHHEARFSRIDLAIDLHGCKLTPQKFYTDWKLGKAKVSAHKARIIEETIDGIAAQTMYTGSRTSERYMRVYEKHLQSALDLSKASNMEYVLRMEMEFKKQWARGVQGALADNPIEDVFNGQFRSYCEYEDKDWLDATSGSYAEPKPLGRKDTNAEKWLLETCATALGKQVAIDASFAKRFFSAYGKALSGFKNKKSAK